jgi:hypothetical protein
VNADLAADAFLCWKNCSGRADDARHQLRIFHQGAADALLDSPALRAEVLSVHVQPELDNEMIKTHHPQFRSTPSTQGAIISAARANSTGSEEAN